MTAKLYQLLKYLRPLWGMQHEMRVQKPRM